MRYYDPTVHHEYRFEGMSQQVDAPEIRLRLTRGGG